ncbi:ubiE/COQ5 methyltransferase, putative [Talaromyces stipitatus ATCC 10500]|uniref:UbiE/COQ5 methyltransferase, putative n=1 Tax=Talaromyces stipitatus (strain ATCC 10500 / CBS 375.48 / QM 6759 / NRRL 1006) TaxID=441959 RepID=B8MIQ9_TALSN|nr:ubiE/COQ5 methyltransferase, putative [Talaromyces stipitatus ATCC 10500]EED15571.1 ubiE/COQ5 methyltransferase, putative [Talaromyces stipitatus ATCC 10500]
MSQSYTNDHSQAVLRTHSWRNAPNSASYLLPHLKPTMSILDVGCGPGSITISLAGKVPLGYVVGVENVLDPLNGARELANSEKVSNVSFQIGDIHDLPFPDDTFDIVHAHQVLQPIADPVQAFKEMRRVIKQGGIVAARECVSSTIYPESEGLTAWQQLGDRVRRAKGNHIDAGSHMHVWANEAGFLQEYTKDSDERKYWGGLMEERARSSGFATNAVREGFATQKDMEKMAVAWRDFVQDEDGWVGLLHGQILCWK